MADIAPVDFTNEPEDTGTQTTLEDFERDTVQAQAPSATPPADDQADTDTSLLSLTDISKLTGLSYVTLRRYAGVHSRDLLPYTEGTGRSLKYKPEAVEMFKRYREESRSGPKPGGGRGRVQQATPAPAQQAPAQAPTVRPTRGRPTGKSLNPKKKGKPARPHKPTTTVVSTPEVASGPVMQEMTRAMDRAVAEMERAQLVTRLETLRGVVEPINREVERLEKMVGMVKV